MSGIAGIGSVGGVRPIGASPTRAATEFAPDPVELAPEPVAPGLQRGAFQQPAFAPTSAIGMSLDARGGNDPGQRMSAQVVQQVAAVYAANRLP